MTRLKAVDAIVQSREALLLFARTFAAEADRLEAEIGQYKAGIDGMKAGIAVRIGDLEAENTRLQREVEALVNGCAELGADLAAAEKRPDSTRLDWLLSHCLPHDPGRDKPLIETREGIDGAMAAELLKPEDPQ